MQFGTKGLFYKYCMTLILAEISDHGFGIFCDEITDPSSIFETVEVWACTIYFSSHISHLMVDAFTYTTKDNFVPF